VEYKSGVEFLPESRNTAGCWAVVVCVSHIYPLFKQTQHW